MAVNLHSSYDSEGSAAALALRSVRTLWLSQSPLSNGQDLGKSLQLREEPQLTTGERFRSRMKERLRRDYKSGCMIRFEPTLPAYIFKDFSPKPQVAFYHHHVRKSHFVVLQCVLPGKVTCTPGQELWSCIWDPVVAVRVFAIRVRRRPDHKSHKALGGKDLQYFIIVGSNTCPRTGVPAHKEPLEKIGQSVLIQLKVWLFFFALQVWTCMNAYWIDRSVF